MKFFSKQELGVGRKWSSVRPKVLWKKSLSWGSFAVPFSSWAGTWRTCLAAAGYFSSQVPGSCGAAFPGFPLSWRCVVGGSAQVNACPDPGSGDLGPRCQIWEVARRGWSRWSRSASERLGSGPWTAPGRLPRRRFWRWGGGGEGRLGTVCWEPGEGPVTWALLWAQGRAGQLGVELEAGSPGVSSPWPAGL